MATRLPVADLVGGRWVDDPYRWLEADDDGDTRRWLAEQQQWLDQHAEQWPARADLRALLSQFADNGGVSAPVVSPPVWRGRARFGLRRGAGQELPVLTVCGADTDDERVLVDPLRIDPTGTTILEAWRPSWSGGLLAYQLSTAGSESPTLRLRDVASGDELDHPFEPGRVTPIAWLADDTGFYYVSCPPAGARQVRLHLLGQHPERDCVVFSTDSRQLSVSTSPSGRWVAVSCAAGAQRGNMIYLGALTARPPQAPTFGLIYDGSTEDSQAQLKFGPDDLLYVITTSRAPGGRVCVIDPAAPHSDSWNSVIAMREREVLRGCVALTQPDTQQIRFLVSSTRSGAAQLTLHERTGAVLASIGTPASGGPGTITGLGAPPDSDQAWFTYTEFGIAPTVYRFSLTDRTCRSDTRRATTERTIPQPRVEQLSYPSEDGTPIPMFLVLPAGARQGPVPTILTAYGGFGASAAPAYSPTILAWTQAGGTYAIAGVRGGGEHGTSWHAAGRGANKPTAFADFTAAARWLIDQRWTTPTQLAIKGSSHSGLMVAVATTRNPDLYAAAVCHGAPTDMIRYPHFGLGPWWINEFGDPNNRAQLDTLLSYSPYHRVTPGTAYPAILVASARHDQRVGAAHSRKFTASLQHATTSGKPILLRTEDAVGHGPRALSRWLDLEADTLAFCAHHTGLNPSRPPA